MRRKRHCLLSRRYPSVSFIASAGTIMWFSLGK